MVGRMTDTLLEAADEVRLAGTIEAGLFATELLSRADFSFARADELTQLQADGLDAWQQFLLSNVRLVQALAFQVARRCDSTVDELFQEGFLGLADAVQRWDFRAGYRFSTYAVQWIRRRVLNASASLSVSGPGSARTVQRARLVRSLDEQLSARLQRVATDAELAEQVGRSADWVGRMRQLQSWVPLEPDLVAVEIDEPQQGGEVLRLLASLPWVEREVVRRRFGIGGGAALHQRAAAEALGLSLSTLRRHEARALRRLRTWLQDDLAA